MRLVVSAVVLLASGAFARAGGIETSSCTGCHGSGSQQTTITLTPSTFNPGETITVRVRIAGTGNNGGLFLSANGVGTLATISGQNTRLSNGAIVHSSPRSASGGAVTFEARWTAPATMGGVEFTTATVLGNGDNNRGGDQGDETQLSQAFGCAGTTYFRDIDGDGVGSSTSGTTRNCMVPLGYATIDGDCDDFDNRKSPQNMEACNGFDDNCNSQTDEGLMTVTTWPDLDGDGFGWALGAPISGCGGGMRAPNDRDCDDTNRNINPSASETCNMKDDDCDGQVDEGAKVRCGEGWCARLGPTCNPVDCMPGPPLLERCNALDDDCDGLVDEGELCGAGSACVAAVCIDASLPPVDAGTNTDGGVSSPRGESTCATTPGLAIAALLVMLVRRRPLRLS